MPVLREEPSALPSIISWSAVGSGALLLLAGAALDAGSVQVAASTDASLSLPAATARERYAQSDMLALGATAGYLSGTLLVVGGAVGAYVTTVAE